MTPAAEALIAELHQEANASRRVLERIPQAELGWRPHPKSMSLGQLAQHVASLPASISRLASVDEFDATNADFTPVAPETSGELLATHDASIAEATEFLAGLSEERAAAPWRMTLGERELMSVPRIGLMRMLAFNHLYHHRGQLLVYLRLLDVPVPVVYGRSADENPFATVPEEA